jgi:SAM-dependent methyltransferase
MQNAIRDILPLLACPESQTPLRLEDGALVTAECRYRVEAGFPILLRRSREAPEATAVRNAFRSRSGSYFEDNYASPRNPERARRRSRTAELLEELVSRDSVVLEAGAGPAVLAEVLEPRVSAYVALDLSLDNLLAARDRIGPFAGVIGDLTALPFADGVFDGTVAVGCLEYVDEVDTAVAELCRVTKPGGFVLMSFANARSPRRGWDEAVTNRLSRMRRRRTRSVYRRRLTTSTAAARMVEGAGATVERVEPFNPGLLGYPLSGLRAVQRVEDALGRRFEPVRRCASELIVLARR